MARQVVGESLKMKIPKYEDTATLDTDDYGGYLSEKFIVTSERTVVIENIDIEKPFCGVEVDVYGSIAGYPFILYFTHPGREIPSELMSPELNQCGIVEVSLRDTYSLFAGDTIESQSYLEKLRHFLAEDIRSKRWVFHPRRENTHAQALLLLEARKKELFQHQSEKLYPKKKVEVHSDITTGTVATTEIQKREVKYQCMMCGSTWIGVEPGYSPCPQCNTHLYAKRVRRPNDET